MERFATISSLNEQVQRGAALQRDPGFQKGAAANGFEQIRQSVDFLQNLRPESPLPASRRSSSADITLLKPGGLLAMTLRQGKRGRRD